MTHDADAQETARTATRRAYGLAIRTEIALPELPACADGRPPDLTIARGATRVVDGPSGAAFDADGATLRWPAVGTFLVRGGGRTIVVEPAPGVPDALVAFPLLGPVLACALHLQGRFLLHASAIRVGGAAVAMMGDKGAGKSTLATALLSAGHPLLADDLVAADPRGSGYETPAAFPQMKLSGATLARLRDPRARVRPRPHPAIDKACVLVGRFAADAAPLARLYVVERGATAAIAPVSREAALRLVLRFGYAARFGAQALGATRAGRHLQRAAGLAQAGLVHRLVVPDGLDRLPEAVAAVEADVRAAALERGHGEDAA